MEYTQLQLQSTPASRWELKEALGNTQRSNDMRYVTKASAFSGSYTDLTNKPTLATVATTGSFNDLTDMPFNITNTQYVKIFGLQGLWQTKIGNMNDINSYGQTAIGNYLKLRYFGTAVGQYNSPTDYVYFTVGCGTGENARKNGFAVDTRGNVYICGINNYDGTNVVHPETGVNSLNNFLNNLSAENVAYDSSETYTSGTVGYAIKQLETNSGGGSSSYSSLSDKPIVQRSGEDGWVFGDPTDSGCPHAYDEYSFAEGYQTTAGDSRDDYDGYAAHAEGDRTTASAQGSHSEGILTEASGSAAHAEGFYSVAEGADSHAEGDHAHTAFRAVGSHAEGSHTQTTNPSEHASGEYNKSNQTISSGGIIVQDGTLFSVGVGSDDQNRANAFEIFTNGQIYIKGVGNYDGTNAGESGVLSLQDMLSSLGFGNTGGSSGSDPYGSDPYASDPYASDPYGNDPYESDPYGSDPYGGGY